MRPRSRLLSYLPAWIVLVLASAVAIAMYDISNRLVARETAIQFDNHARDIQELIKSRARAYRDVLVSVQAYFGTHDNVTRQEFHDFFTGLKLAGRYPGFQIINYAPYVPAAQLDAFVAAQRQDPALQAAGVSYTVKPPGARDGYYVITYAEPLDDNLVSLGIDMGAGERRLKALEQGRDTGKPISSGLLIRPKGGAPYDVGIAIRLPVYRKGMPAGTVEERRAAYIGSVGAGIRMKDLMSGLIPAGQLRELHFKIYDGGPVDGALLSPDAKRLLFDSAAFTQSDDATPGSKAAGSATAATAATAQTAQTASSAAIAGHLITQQLVSPFAGRRWLIEFSADSAALQGADRYTPSLVLFSGLAIAMLLGLVTYALGNSRERALVLARQMTHNLRESQIELAEAQRIAHMGSWRYDPHKDALSCSDELTRLIGKTSHRRMVTGKGELRDLLDVIDQSYHAALCARIDAAMHSGQGFEMECEYRSAKGRQGWLHLIARVPADNRSRVLRGTAMEITHRKLAEHMAQIEHAVVVQLATSGADKDIISPLIKTLCNGLRLDAAAFWPTRAGRLQGLQSARFAAAGELTSWLAGACSPLAGLDEQPPEARAPQWLNRAADITALPHAEWLAAEGIETVFAISLQLESTLLGVVELYARKHLPTAATALTAAESIANQVEQFMRRRRAEAELRYVANHDALTGLPNRLLFNETLQTLLAQADQESASFHLMFIDIDQFKNINDTLGHDTGDDLLKACAERLRESLPHVRMLARLGGDEFIVLLAEDPAHPLQHEQQGLLDTLKTIQSLFAVPVMLGENEHQVTVSIGVSTFPQDGIDASSLMKHADIAMYRAKEQGKNTWQLYAQQMGVALQKEVNLESYLWRALSNKEFELYYQPRRSLATGRITGVEALIRWHHPTMGLVHPQQFIPIAEKSGMIVPIGAWVLREACRQGALWRQRGLSDLRVAVNLSARQFLGNDLMHDVMVALHTSGMAANGLELEITESVMMRQPEQIGRYLARLRDKGLWISVDDFGIGYSSLAYLKRFPINAIKIDRSFITHIPENESDMQITSSVIALAHCLHLQVVAEGVENDAHVAFLREHGCDEIQGYILSRPQPADAITRYLLEQQDSAPGSIAVG